METNYLNKKVRKGRWAWNFGILNRRPIAVRENRQWIPAISYCRYADDFVVVVKGTKAHAEAMREACRGFLEGQLKLTLNMEKTHVTHVNDGFVFFGHRIIRKRGPRGLSAQYRGRSTDALPRNWSSNCRGITVQIGSMSWKAWIGNLRDGRTSVSTPTLRPPCLARWIALFSGNLGIGLRVSIDEASRH